LTEATAALRRAIKLYDGPVQYFAADILGRSRVSVWRWLNGSQIIPAIVAHRLRVYLQHPVPRHVDSLTQPGTKHND